MKSNKIILICTIVLLLLVFFFLMIGITLDLFINNDELKIFLTGIVCGFIAVILIPITEIEKEYTPHQYEDAV